MTTQAPDDLVLTIQEMARRSGFSEATLRYYEKVGLLGPVERDRSSGHRRYDRDTAQRVEALACLRSSGVGIADMRRYLELLGGDGAADRGGAGGGADAGAMTELFAAHARRVAAEVRALQVRLDYLTAKTELWGARTRGDHESEARAAVDVARALDRF